MKWKQAIERWRRLPVEEQARLRRNRIPMNVAFEEEPVELAALQGELACLDTPPDTASES